MILSKRLSVLLFLLDIPCIVLTTGMQWNHYDILCKYPLARVITEQYDYTVVKCAFFSALFVLPILIVGYNLNKPKVTKFLFLLSVALFLFACLVDSTEIMLASRAKKYFDPKIVQSTMIEIDLQQLEELQKNRETTMIYFGRPSCGHCNEIKPNLDILVNNSHSMVYYYNTEQDRDDNHDEMQAVLDTYGVATVPALVVWADAGETKEIYFNEDIVDYFLDTDRFSY